MLQIKENVIEDFDSSLEEQLVDWAMLTDFIYHKAKTKYGETKAKILLQKTILKIQKEG